MITKRNEETDEELFSISGNFGGGEKCVEAILPLDRLLRKSLSHLKAADYLDGLSGMEIWLRVGGDLTEWDGESGPMRLASGRNPPRLIVDLVVPRSEWEDKNQDDIKEHFARGVEACFELMLARALKRNAVKDEPLLRADFCEAMESFRTHPVPPYVPLGTPQYL